MSERSSHHRKDKVQSGTSITAHATKQGAEGVVKGGVETAETVSHFQYAPTLIALFPVFASFFFGSHTEHWTDLILLGLVAVYLHNCVSVPWGYYKASRRRYKTSDREIMTDKQRTIESQLRIAELEAFGGLIVGPLLGAALLNYVRSTMARPANGLITNFNITVFVLAAELRPLRIAFEYLTKRSSNLQEELTDVVPARYEAMQHRLEELANDLHNVRTSFTMNDASLELNSHHKTSFKDDSEIGQLKYALKKFEKYEANAKHELESKIYTLERRLADLSARTQPVSASASTLMHILLDLLLLPVQLLWKAITLPLRLVERATSSFLYYKKDH